MTITKLTLKALLGATALTAFTAGSAYAQHVPGTENNFTQAGDTVSNTFTLNYNVGGTPQPPIDNTGGIPNDPDGPTEFTVDRLVDVTVNSEGNNTVAPGATNEELIFSVVNDSNDTFDYVLSIVEEGGDDFNTDDPADSTAVIRYYIDDGDGVFQTDGTDGVIQTYNAGNPPQLGPDEVLWVVITQDIPSGVVDTNTADISLVADTVDSTSHVAVTGDGDGNTLDGVAENVLVDGSGTANENANEGDHSATGTYLVASADLAASKAVVVHDEAGTGCTTTTGAAIGGYAIPGACVEYVITVVNSGTQAATSVVINDVLADELEFGAASFEGDFTGGSFASPALPANGTDCVSGACVVNLTGATLPAPIAPATSTTGTVTIRALIK
jgi:uncharacterized repeat protein (TIGR01451 family)